MGLFGIKISLRNPFGKHSLFRKATQVASLLPIPGSGLVSKALSLANRGQAAYQALRRMAPPAATFASTPPTIAMPGGAAVAVSTPPQRQHRTRRRGSRKRKRRR